jgi:hypothetical integral membrane protein (TIGR02206 family)
VADKWYDYFWVTQYQSVPPDLAMGSFTWTHLGTVVVLAIGIALTVRGYCRLDTKRRRTMRLIVGLVVLALQLFRQVPFIVLGTYQPAVLPFHLCAVACFCVIIDAIRPNAWCREFTYALGTWGPACAMLFPDWSNLPILNVNCWQSFLIHAALVAYALMLLVSGELRPDPRQLWKGAVIMLVSVGVSAVANHIWDTNFWFLNTGSPGSPLAPIQAVTGRWYLPCLAGLLAVLWTGMYLPWRHREKRPASVGA